MILLDDIEERVKVVHNDITKRIEYWEYHDSLFPWIETLVREEDYPESHHLE